MIRTKIMTTAVATAILAATSVVALAAEGPAAGGTGGGGAATEPGVNTNKAGPTTTVTGTTGSAASTLKPSTEPNVAVPDRRGEKPSAEEAAPAGR